MKRTPSKSRSSFSPRKKGNPYVDVSSPAGSFSLHASTRYEAERVAERMRKEHTRRRIPAEVTVRPNPAPRRKNTAASPVPPALRKLVRQHGGVTVLVRDSTAWFAFPTRRLATEFYEDAAHRGFQMRRVIQPETAADSWTVGVSWQFEDIRRKRRAPSSKWNPDVDVLAIRRAAKAAGFPGLFIRKGTGSLRGAVQVLWPRELPDAVWTSRASLWLRTHYPDVPFVGLRPQAFVEYWIGRPGTNVVGFARGAT